MFGSTEHRHDEEQIELRLNLFPTNYFFASVVERSTRYKLKFPDIWLHDFGSERHSVSYTDPSHTAPQIEGTSNFHELHFHLTGAFSTCLRQRGYEGVEYDTWDMRSIPMTLNHDFAQRGIVRRRRHTSLGLML